MSNDTRCAANGCDRTRRAREWCDMHYKRWRRHGDANTVKNTYGNVGYPFGTIHDRFWAKVDKSGECWEWTASKFENGYGCFSQNGKSQKAHRIAWEMENGSIPAGAELDHLCHTRDTECVGGKSCKHRRCVRPSHLEPVTHAENTRRGLAARGSHQSKKTHCKKNHEFTPENTHIYQSKKGTVRYCRTCNRDRLRVRRQENMLKRDSLASEPHD